MSDTEPPVTGATSIHPGSNEYDSVLLAYCVPITQNGQCARTEAFTISLMRILAAYGVHDVHRLVLSKGAGSREMLSLTLRMAGNTMLSYQVMFPFGSDPFMDPGWVAAEVIRQSSAARCSLLPGRVQNEG
jgi:hypothetical protein